MTNNYLDLDYEGLWEAVDEQVQAYGFASVSLKYEHTGSRPTA